MEQSAVLFMEKCKELKRLRLEEHKQRHIGERECRGLNEREWFRVTTRQKSTFSKGKKFSHTRLWNYKNINPLNK